MTRLFLVSASLMKNGLVCGHMASVIVAESEREAKGEFIERVEVERPGPGHFIDLPLIRDITDTALGVAAQTADTTAGAAHAPPPKPLTFKDEPHAGEVPSEECERLRAVIVGLRVALRPYTRGDRVPTRRDHERALRAYRDSADATA